MGVLLEIDYIAALQNSKCGLHFDVWLRGGRAFVTQWFVPFLHNVFANGARHADEAAL